MIAKMLFKELIESKLLKDLALESYNSACERMNNGLIDAFNKAWESKGKTFGTIAYESAYERLFDKIWTEEITKIKGKFTIEEIMDAFKSFKIIIK